MKNGTRIRHANGRTGRFLAVDDWDTETAWVEFDDADQPLRVTRSLLKVT